MKTVPQISIFKSVFDKVPSMETSIYNFYSNIVQGDYKQEVEAIHQESDPEQIKKLKMSLPAATISGTFSERKAGNLIQHSGRICVDIDSKENPGINMKSLRRTVGTWKEIEFSALSASGNGVFCVILISQPAKHIQHFKQLERDFRTLGINIDRACKDVSRLRFMTWDPEAVYNVNVDPYRKIYTPPPPPPDYGHGSPEVKKLVAWLEEKHSLYFTPGSRHEFIKQLAGACHRLGVPESETRGELMQYAREDFPAKEIEGIICYMYTNPKFSK